MFASTDQIAALTELSLRGSVVSASRARIILRLAQNPDMKVDDLAFEFFETRDFVRWAIRKFKLFGVEGLVEKQREIRPRNENRDALVVAARRGETWLCKACADADESYALRGKCQRCKWGRKQIVYSCSCLEGARVAGPMMSHLRAAHDLTREQAFALLDTANTKMEEDAGPDSD